MREIKFRAWRPEERRIVEVLSIDWAYGDIHFARNEKDKEWAITPSTGLANVELLQYTGLKDKNDKEIYEGDIVSLLSRFSSAYYEVYWDDRNCQFRLCAKGDRQFDKTHDLRMRADIVIGNIYENPELVGIKSEQNQDRTE